MIMDSNGRMPQAAINIIEENVTIGIQPYSAVSYPSVVMYENAPNIVRDIPVPSAEAVNSGFRPILSTKLGKRKQKNIFTNC